MTSPKFPLDPLLRPAAPAERARAAALLAIGADISDAEAGRQYKVTREAVRQARGKLVAGGARRKPGRPRAAVQRPHFLSVRLAPGHAVSLRASDEERAAYERVASEGGISAWVRSLLTADPCPEGVPLLSHLRRIARRAAGMSEECRKVRRIDIVPHEYLDDSEVRR